ncbi:MAG: hypothetical protein ONB05_00750, partial [candidate division KSB1 bacterium]|nr:hypothetical protein [candidate division KSB1 bacterium]
MPSPFTKLKDRVRLLGNHHQKYLRTIELHHEALIEKLETKGLIDQVHLWKSAPNLSEEMNTIVEVGETLEQKLAFLGCYYAMQFLHTNLRSIDVLMLNLTTTADRLAVYQNFMRGIGSEFRLLTAHYMAKLLDLFIPEDQRPEFALLGVGTRADQDDIDIGIIDDGS